jgi:hypothetical protein
LQDGAFGVPQILKDSDVWQRVELPGLAVQLQKLWFA